MHTTKTYDLIGIGIGPFNLGLAALCAEISELDCLFIDQAPAFNWHHGMLIPGTRMQVPFYADLVSLADPTNQFSYFNFLKSRERMFRFAIREQYYLTRAEYNTYCQWVASNLSSLRFNCRCLKIERYKDHYALTCEDGVYFARHIVIGTGSNPVVPPCVKELLGPTLFHSSNYLLQKDRALKAESITVIGSGQSAGEIFYDLLKSYKGDLSWFTRSSRIIPMDDSRFAMELSTPSYIDHFYGLFPSTQQEVLEGQGSLYKGINASLINEIYQYLDETGKRPLIQTSSELKKVTTSDGHLELAFYHHECKTAFRHSSEIVILATGYQASIPDFINELGLSKHTSRNYALDNDNTIFIQHAEAPTHGFSSADLSLGPYRNSCILNCILKREQYRIEKDHCFQSFGVFKELDRI